MFVGDFHVSIGRFGGDIYRAAGLSVFAQDRHFRWTKFVCCPKRQSRIRTDGTGICRTFDVRDASPKSLKFVNVDIDGEQANDGQGTAVTYSGAARFGAAGDFWNSLKGVDDTVSSAVVEELRDSAGKKTKTSFGVIANGGNIHFDKGTDDSNDLMDDYIYGFSANCYTVEIGGLVPGAYYDVWAYCGVGGGYLPDATAFSFNLMSVPIGNAPARSVFGWQAKDCVQLAGFEADETGAISFVCGNNGSGAPFILNGLQITGRDFRYESGFSVFVR